MSEPAPALPERLAAPLLERLLARRRSAFVQVDGEGRVLDAGGELAWFGIESVARGDAIAERLETLQGFLPPEAGGGSLQRVELVPGRASELHVLDVAGGATLVLLDATEDAARELHYQQRGNELSLLLRTWGVAVFERLEGGFRSLGHQPAWLRSLAGGAADFEELLERLPFLENFLVDAEEVWSRSGPGVEWSGVWTEVDARGAEWHLEASASRVEDGRCLLLVQSVDRRHFERQSILQEARSRSLEHHELRREIDKKETLLHCIVHDLRGPLSGMVGTMSLLKSRKLDPERSTELLELGLEQARSQEALLRAILDAFAAEVESLQAFESEARHAPDLLAALGRALEAYAPAFEQNGVRGESHVPQDLEEARVVGEPSRLERVLYNLLENALRHSPEGGTVRVTVRGLEDAFELSVEDEGPGVPPELEPGLFQKFHKGRRGGAVGLGLYFCRSTIETWGGAIGYERRSEVGSRFWFRLRRALA